MTRPEYTGTQWRTKCDSWSRWVRDRTLWLLFMVSEQ